MFPYWDHTTYRIIISVSPLLSSNVKTTTTSSNQKITEHLFFNCSAILRYILKREAFDMIT